jgi:hypothetical protein
MSRPNNPLVRNRQLNISLTGSELDDVRALADAAGQKPIDFGRSKILEERTRHPQKNYGSTTLRLIYAQLARIGAALNQLVRRVQATKEPMPADLEPLLRDIRRILSERNGDDR